MYFPFSELERGDLFYFHPQYDVEGIENGDRCVKTGSNTFQVHNVDIQNLKTFKLKPEELHATKVTNEKDDIKKEATK